MKTAWLFPGQGAQHVGMISPYCAESIYQERCQQASDILHRDVHALMQSDPESCLHETAWTQPALLIAGVIVYEIWRDRGGFQPTCMLGHSLGEYTALTCAGALDFETAVALVHQRGKSMQQAVPAGQGAMAAVLGLTDEAVRSVCETIGPAVQAANYNAPAQVVISGWAQAVEEASALARARGAKKVIPLSVSVPSHSLCMQIITEEWRDYLQQIVLRMPEIPVIHNVDAQTASDLTGLRERLVQQLAAPVQWVACVQSAIRDYQISQVCESGPGQILLGLMKRIDATIPGFRMDHPEAMEKLIHG